jgi:hypothetical protein
MVERTEKDETARIRWLKATVIGLGIVFLGLATLLIVLIMTGGPKRTGSAAGTAAPRSVAVEDLEFAIPRNSRVAEVFATGNRIVLRVRLADGTERLYALDGETLKPLGSLTVKVEK